MSRRATRAWVVGCCLGLLSVGASAQVRHRRPLGSAPSVRYGYDNNGGSSGCRDYNCGSRCYDGHSGTDFPVPLGTTVLASADGVVSATNNGCANYGGLGNSCGGRCGNYVQIRHSDGAYTIFCHMQLNSLMVSRGQRVRCGQAIGRSASSGNSTGPHLHFGWRRTSASIDSYRGRCTSSPGAWTDQGAYGASPGATCACVASAETCNNRDDDCDGRVDDGLSRSCYTGPSGTAGRGVCRNGTQTCGAGAWRSCSGQVVPSAEGCNNRDDDCDGRVDDGLSRSCYTGPAGTSGRGICRGGTQTCAAGAWGGCSGQVVPRAESCNRLDDDCDGMVDEGACGTDAGTRPDVVAVTDVGNDVGSDVGSDVGNDIGNDDAGGVDDAGVEEDAGVEDDVVEFEDVGSDEPDPSELDPVGPTAAEEGGCGCGVVGSEPAARGPWGLLLGAALLAVARRRRRGQG